MKIKEFEITGFRNLERVKLVPGLGLNGFWGPNGQGKTNLLEALYAALRGKSFRDYAGRGDWVPEKPDLSTNIHIELENSRGYQFDCTLHRDLGPEGRWEFYFNGKKAKLHNVREQIPVVVFSPDDHALIRKSPENRRRFLDEMLSDVIPGYADVENRFQKTLKNRNELLKKVYSPELRGELRTWTELFAHSAYELSTLRLESWPTFEKRFEKTALELFDQEWKGVLTEFEPNLSDEDWITLPSAQKIMEKMEESMAADLATGWTHKGPHRDDFKILLPGGGDARAKSSQGQARVLALALRWTHADWVRDERGEQPLFFIDDFSSELDSRRRGALLAYIQGQKGQLFVRGTERSLVDSEAFSEYKHWGVNEGLFSPL